MLITFSFEWEKGWAPGAGRRSPGFVRMSINRRSDICEEGGITSPVFLIFRRGEMLFLEAPHVCLGVEMHWREVSLHVAGQILFFVLMFNSIT